jgi:hypothetical protein
MVTLGADAHKRSHSLVAVDDIGRKLGAHTVAATSTGHLEALRWARRWRPRRWAVEDCRHVTRSLEKDLLSAGEVVVRVPPQMAAEGRRSLRERGKSDPIDALAVARTALREADLPEAHLDDHCREVKLLLDHREDLVGERTRIQNRLQWLLHELEPEFQVASGALAKRPMSVAFAPAPPSPCTTEPHPFQLPPASSNGTGSIAVATASSTLPCIASLLARSVARAAVTTTFNAASLPATLSARRTEPCDVAFPTRSSASC